MSQFAYVVVEKSFGPENQIVPDFVFITGVFLNYEDIPNGIRHRVGEHFPGDGSVSFVQKANKGGCVVIEVHKKEIGVLDE